VFFLSAASIAWVAIHGLGDNTDLTADPICLIPYAMTIAVVLQSDRILATAQNQSHSARPAFGDAGEAEEPRLRARRSVHVS
jgi:hypothetical protein